MQKQYRGKHAPGNSNPFYAKQFSHDNGNNHASSGQISEISKYSRSNNRYTPLKKKYHWLKGLTGLIAVFLLVACTLFAFSAKTVLDEISDVSGLAKQFQQSITSGTQEDFSISAQNLSSSLKNMEAKTSGILWQAFSFLPVIGQDISIAQELCATAGTVAADVIDPSVERVAPLDSPQVVRDDGSLNAGVIQAFVESLAEASEPIHEHAVRLVAEGDSHFDFANKRLRTFRNAIKGLDKLAAASPTLAPNIPYLLGADGSSRTFLVVAQSNAEIRSTGGYPGSFGPMEIADGKFSLGEFGGIKSVLRYDQNDIGEGPPATNEELALFGNRIQLMFGESNVSPDFPRVAEMWCYMWEGQGHGNIDGVIALDPIFFQSLLAVTGPIALGNGDILDNSNTGKFLMHDIYWQYSSEEQDAIFAEAAHVAFNNLLDNMDKLDIVKLVKLLWHAADTRHLQFFTENANAQFSFDYLGYSGSVSHDLLSPTLGVYVTDDTWGKMCWYLSKTTEIESETHNPDGSITYSVITTLRNNISEQEESELPAYVSSHNHRARTRGDIISWLFLFAPEGGVITDVVSEGYFTPTSLTYTALYGKIDTAGMNKGNYEGLDVWYGQVQMNRNENIRVSYKVTTSSQASSSLRIDTTPTAQDIAGWK